jgi:L-fucose isomerase-like protein
MVQVLVVDVIESWALADWGSGNPDKESVALCKLFGVDIRKIQSQELARYNAGKAARKKKVSRAVKKIKARGRVGRQSTIGRVKS